MQIEMMRGILLFTVLVAACNQVYAASAKTEIYTDEMTKKGESDVNLGIGRGTTAVSNHRVAIHRRVRVQISAGKEAA